MWGRSKGSPLLHNRNQEYKCKMSRECSLVSLPLEKIFIWHNILIPQKSGYENGNKRVIYIAMCVCFRDDEIKEIIFVSIFLLRFSGKPPKKYFT